MAKENSEQTATKNKVARVLSVSAETLDHPPQDKPCTQCQDLDFFIALLKIKFELASKQEQIKLLTLIPESWSIKKAVKEFGTSEHLVRKARKFKTKTGILSDPKPKKGKALSPETIDKVTIFYQSDENSQMCPGKT